MDELKYRHIDRAHLHQIENIVLRSAEFTEMDKEQFGFDLAEIDDYVPRFVCTDDIGTVAGFVMAQRVSVTKNTYQVHWIATHPDFRRRGVYKRLNQMVEDWVRENGGARPSVFHEVSGKHGEIPMNALLRQGYMMMSVFTDFYDRGDDRITLVKRL